MRVKIHKGDTVQIISGRKKGERGEVIKVLPELTQIVVQGINLRKKHKRQMQTQGRTINPGIIEYEAPIHLSNVMLVCPKCDKPSRVSIQRIDGEVKRLCKSCESEIV